VNVIKDGLELIVQSEVKLILNLQGCKDFCNMNGVCDTNSWSCKCNIGFKGEYCDYTVCPHQCFGNGLCSNDGN
jgi:hypothetical protein